MTLTIYRSNRALYHRDDLVFQYDAYAFDPKPLAAKEVSPGVSKVRWASVPVIVVVPMGSRIVDYKGHPRLATHFDPVGLDAEAVAYLALHGERGFRIDGSTPCSPMPAN
jgi:hypothetical protein